ncbi:hypothetical protein [Micromonospora sp. bgisy143]|uniref:hypothetical protein n=1 Tax=Micromonospora sp. bgisy143 TaxID=3413790 RepID=UPI003EB8B3C2
MASRPRKSITPRKTCERLSLTDATKRRLWSESGGYCANPECATALFDDDADIDFAEMAHIVAASSGGPRDVDVAQLSKEQRAHHSNVVVLCANCHTKVDKAPGTYPIRLLQHWKARHEDTLRRVFGTPTFSTRYEARAFVNPLLDENRSIFLQYGPTPGDFSESRASQWRRHVARSIVPNNAVIDRVLKLNRSLLGQQERTVADLFSIHAAEFSARHLLNDWTAGSTRFPDGMEKIFEGEAV